MSAIDFLIAAIASRKDHNLLVWQDDVYTGADFMNAFDAALNQLREQNVISGSIVRLTGDYAPQTIAMLFALIKLNATVTPLTPSSEKELQNEHQHIPYTHLVRVLDGKTVEIDVLIPGIKKPDLLKEIATRGVPGLVLYTSGSSGTPKAVIHDFAKLLSKFETPRPAYHTVNFLMFDHWGGLNTLFHSLANGGLLALPSARTPDYICGLISEHKLQLLPATPSFLNLLILSQAWKSHDLSSLKVISYGAEPMPETTLKRLKQIFPDIDFKQTYGMIELGVLRAKSENSESLWVKVGGEGYDVRVVDGILQIKSETAMLGYLNAASPFTDDGYLITGDRVEQKGEYLRILGRDSEIINVGGQKVYPAEVESVLMSHDSVIDAVAYAEPNPILGHIVSAKIKHDGSGEVADIREILKAHCAEYLDSYKIPVRLRLTTDSFETPRLKKQRKNH